MFSSFSLLSIPFSVPRFLQSGRGLAVEINPVEVHDVEILPEKRARVLKHLLKLNHVNHSIIYHHLQFHNHMPHVCVASATQLPKLMRMLRYSLLRICLEPTANIWPTSTMKSLKSSRSGRILRAKFRNMTGESIWVTEGMYWSI